MAVKRIILIRPGETEWNRQGRIQGWLPVPLNDHGRQQAQRLTNFIRNIGAAALYSSDLRRASETADLLAEKLGFPPILDARLRERNLGQWQGLTLFEVQSWFAEEYKQLLTNIWDFPVPGGETLNQVKTRVLASFSDILAQTPDANTVAIMSHTTAIRVLLSELIPGYELRDASIENTSVTTIANTSDGWHMIMADDVAHLEGLQTSAFRELEDKK